MISQKARGTEFAVGRKFRSIDNLHIPPKLHEQSSNSHLQLPHRQPFLYASSVQNLSMAFF